MDMKNKFNLGQDDYQIATDEPLDLDDEVVNASPETVEVVEDIISDETV